MFFPKFTAKNRTQERVILSVTFKVYNFLQTKLQPASANLKHKHYLV